MGTSQSRLSLVEDRDIKEVEKTILTYFDVDTLSNSPVRKVAE